jgi:hypothetical protein
MSSRWCFEWEQPRDDSVRDDLSLSQRVYVCECVATYHQVADNDLHNLGLQASTAGKDLLEKVDEDVADGSSNQGTVGSHLGHSRGKVVAMLVAVLGEERSEELLNTVESTGCEHLGAERV